ncbi:bacteriocin biosynthesis cyclodehydratase domain-containing protein [Kribbella sp. VKM Ac-2571]|uniref:TOMM precursor leader peptide-binding protein n=1 Tax=Kribbella sp. VKM Ac-2571 TaxID=2512222 RepID=UPI0010E8D1EA|nr:TOMM precursor leader peptide-binding protein [Kribbella sp. VKM Ac-2571]TDO58266.1 bacteriocin biosynthesis cyclodehydratase domain-containing protein [Kribbella sp. VKM Ac-2571]
MSREGQPTFVRTLPWLMAKADADSVTLMAGVRALSYRGGAARLLKYVLPLLDGQRTAVDIAESVGAPHLAEPIARMCRRMVADGFAVDVNDGAAQGWAPWAASDVPASTRPLHVVGTSDEYRAFAAAAPAGWSPEHVHIDKLADADNDSGAIGIVWVADRNSRDVAEWNEVACAKRLPWLPISHFDGQMAAVGPLIVPPDTACFECYRRRRAAALGLGLTGLEVSSVASTHPADDVAMPFLAGLAMLLVHRWVTRADPYVPGAVWTVIPGHGVQVGTEFVLRVPRCPVCRPTAATSRTAPWSDYAVNER